MDDNISSGLSLAGVRRTQGGTSAIRSQRNQRRVREKLIRDLEKDFRKKTGHSPQTEKGQSHELFAVFIRNVREVSRQVLIA